MNSNIANNSVNKIETNLQQNSNLIPSPVTDNLIMSQTTILPTYQQVITRIEIYLKYPSQMSGNVFGWMSEYSERNHARMIVIVSKLLKIKEDFYHEDFDVPEEDKKEIFKIGCDIDKDGGFQAQQACFYIVRNFIEPDNNRTKAIEVCWNRAGSWRY
jgi:hypothetical protein